MGIFRVPCAVLRADATQPYVVSVSAAFKLRMHQVVDMHPNCWGEIPSPSNAFDCRLPCAGSCSVMCCVHSHCFMAPRWLNVADRTR